MTACDPDHPCQTVSLVKKRLIQSDWHIVVTAPPLVFAAASLESVCPGATGKDCSNTGLMTCSRTDRSSRVAENLAFMVARSATLFWRLIRFEVRNGFGYGCKTRRGSEIWLLVENKRSPNKQQTSGMCVCPYKPDAVMQLDTGVSKACELALTHVTKCQCVIDPGCIYGATRSSRSRKTSRFATA